MKTSHASSPDDIITARIAPCHTVKNNSNFNLTDQQVRIVNSKDRFIQVIAAAGSGKTQTVMQYVQNVLIGDTEKKNRVLILSFSKKAVRELVLRLDRVYQHRVEISTFHSYCYRRLLFKLNHSSNKYKLITQSQKQEFVKNHIQSKPHEIGGIPFALFADHEKLMRYNPVLASSLSTAFRNYKMQNNFLEFEDLVTGILDELKEATEYSRNLKREFSHIVVDEFQDTDPLQLQFLERLQPERLLVVGDDYQAIYGFRGATVQPFLNFKNHFPSVKVYRLSENFRSVGSIVRAGNKIIKNSSRQMNKKVRSNRTDFRKNHILSTCFIPENISELINQIIHSPLQYMVLVRTNFQRTLWIQNGMPANFVSTIHKSKGLEFQNVIIDLFSGWSSAVQGRLDSGNKDEEIRLHYVAASRAKDQLLVLFNYHPEKRTIESEYYRKLYKSFCTEIEWHAFIEYIKNQI